jgi:hypothetical protein
MSRNRKQKADRDEGLEITTLTGDAADFLAFLRGRDPGVMGSLLRALEKRRILFSWLTPGRRVIGVPNWAGLHPLWLTLVDDRAHAAAAGPDSFDRPSLEWWANHRALALVVDATRPLAWLYERLPMYPAAGQGVLIVQTVEDRRLLWHEYLRDACVPGMHAVVIDIMTNPRPETQGPLLRVGRLGDDFGPNGPSSPGSFAAVTKPV